MDVVTAAQFIRDDFQVQLALRGDHGLAQFGIDHMQEGGIFMVQGGQPGGDLIFLAFDAAL